MPDGTLGALSVYGIDPLRQPSTARRLQPHDHSPAVNVLIVQVDLFSAEGALPRNLDPVMERHKDIMYSSKTRFDTAHLPGIERERGALRRLLRKLPAYLKIDPDVRMLEAARRRAHIDIVRLINRCDSSARHAKDYEFARETINELRTTGLNDATRVVAEPQTLVPIEISENARLYDVTQRSPEEVRRGGMTNEQATIVAQREPKGAWRKLLHHWREKLPSRKKSS